MHTNFISQALYSLGAIVHGTLNILSKKHICKGDLNLLHRFALFNSQIHKTQPISSQHYSNGCAAAVAIAIAVTAIFSPFKLFTPAHSIEIKVFEGARRRTSRIYTWELHVFIYV